MHSTLLPIIIQPIHTRWLQGIPTTVYLVFTPTFTVLYPHRPIISARRRQNQLRSSNDSSVLEIFHAYHQKLCSLPQQTHKPAFMDGTRAYQILANAVLHSQPLGLMQRDLSTMIRWFDRFSLPSCARESVCPASHGRDRPAQVGTVDPSLEAQAIRQVKVGDASWIYVQ